MPCATVFNGWKLTRFQQSPLGEGRLTEPTKKNIDERDDPGLSPANELRADSGSRLEVDSVSAFGVKSLGMRKGVADVAIEVGSS